jgi:hypothetical protein
VKNACHVCGDDMPMGSCQRCEVDRAIDDVCGRPGGVFKDELLGLVMRHLGGRCSPQYVASRLSDRDLL